MVPIDSTTQLVLYQSQKATVRIIHRLNLANLRLGLSADAAGDHYFLRKSRSLQSVKRIDIVQPQGKYRNQLVSDQARTGKFSDVIPFHDHPLLSRQVRKARRV